MPNMLARGILCQLDFVAAEMHEEDPLQNRTLPGWRPAIIGQSLGVPKNFARSFAYSVAHAGRDCRVNFTFMDDESYLFDGKPLPAAP